MNITATKPHRSQRQETSLPFEPPKVPVAGLPELAVASEIFILCLSHRAQGSLPTRFLLTNGTQNASHLSLPKMIFRHEEADIYMPCNRAQHLSHKPLCRFNFVRAMAWRINPEILVNENVGPPKPTEGGPNFRFLWPPGCSHRKVPLLGE